MKPWHRKRPTGAAVKESCDNLPTGLCFAGLDGMPLLVNRRMYELCIDLTGQDLQDANAFWAVLTTGSLTGDARRVSEPGAEHPVILLDGAYRTFARRELDMDGTPVVEITAADTTALYRAAGELARGNEELRQVNQRLRKHGEQAFALTRSDELLSAKVRIHNEIGQTLTATRRLLAMEREEEAGQVLASWRHITDMLLGESAPRKSLSPLEQLQDAADVLGMKLTIRGQLPSGRKDMELLVTVAAEMLTNAFRHAGATELTVEAEAGPLTCRARFTNDGAPPEKEITEGGGLGSLRCRVEKLGGSFRVESRPAFSLTIQFPRQEDD